VAAPALFLLPATLLSVADRTALREWGWTATDHHGVPWPSSLALLPHGRLQIGAFGGTGAALIGLAAALPRSGRAAALAVCGAGLAAAAFPLDRPMGDPAGLGAWVCSWPAVVHAAGFLTAGVAGPVAVASSGRRPDVVFAGGLAAMAAVGRTPGWYAYLAGFFGWVTVLATRTITDRPT
jgi:hypothetical protein